MLNWYNKNIVPKILNKEMGNKDFNETREDVSSRASGITLEIGFGSGFNLPFYKNVTKLYALEPSDNLYQYAKERVVKASFKIEHLSCGAEHIPLPDSSVDSVISTWTLCSVENPHQVLKEIYRILKPGGIFAFAEHGLAKHKLSKIIQKSITPISKHFTGNCHLDRNIEALIREAGFTFEYINKAGEKYRPLMFAYHGVAIKK